MKLNRLAATHNLVSWIWTARCLVKNELKQLARNQGIVLRNKKRKLISFFYIYNEIDEFSILKMTAKQTNKQASNTDLPANLRSIRMNVAKWAHSRYRPNGHLHPGYIFSRRQMGLGYLPEIKKIYIDNQIPQSIILEHRSFTSHPQS